MPLSGIVEPLAPPSIDVAAIALEFLAQEFVFLFDRLVLPQERLVGVVRLIEGGEQVLDPLLGGVGGGSRVAGGGAATRAGEVGPGMAIEEELSSPELSHAHL